MADDLTLLGVASPLEARIWRDALAQEGIPVLLRQADQLGPAGYTPTIGDLQVYVRKDHERRARWIIGDSVEPATTVPQDELAPETGEEKPVTRGD